MPGQAGILEDLNRTYISNINELPYSSGTPEKNIQTSGHISGWIDIVGFKDMIMDDGVYYVPGNPADYAIVMADAGAGELQSRVVLDYRVRCYWCFVSSFDKKISVTQQGNQTVATLYVTLKWYEAIENSGSIQKIDYAESATFEDRETSPSQFRFPTKQAITIEKYRRAVPKEIIKLRDMDKGIIAYRITTGNGSVTHRRKIGKVEMTPKGIFFMNLTPLSVWERTGSGIYHFGDDPIMGDDTITDITFDTAYGPAPNINSSGIVYHENKETSIDPGVWSILYVVLIFFAGIYIMYKSSGY